MLTLNKRQPPDTLVAILDHTSSSEFLHVAAAAAEDLGDHRPPVRVGRDGGRADVRVELFLVALVHEGRVHVEAAPAALAEDVEADGESTSASAVSSSLRQTASCSGDTPRNARASASTPGRPAR